jgi:hypothetical protein
VAWGGGGGRRHGCKCTGGLSHLDPMVRRENIDYAT